MPAKLKNNVTATRPNPPQKITDEVTFFKRLSFELSSEQKVFRDAIYSPDNDVIFVNARAGSGKTTVAVATACYMKEVGLCDNIVYCFTPVNFQNTIGLLPGTVEEKVAPFMEPLCEALIECGYQPDKVISQLNPDGEKNGDAFVSCVPHTFMRGTNIGDRTILILDETQNFFADELKKVLTRVKKGKAIIIGHSGQCDLFKNSWMSGFVPYIQHFKGHERVAICELTENHRSWVSQWADELDIKKLKENQTEEVKE